MLELYSLGQENWCLPSTSTLCWALFLALFIAVYEAHSSGLILYMRKLRRVCWWRVVAINYIMHNLSFVIYYIRLVLVIVHSGFNITHHYFRELENEIVDSAHKSPLRWVSLSLSPPPFFPPSLTLVKIFHLLWNFSCWYRFLPFLWSVNTLITTE